MKRTRRGFAIDAKGQHVGTCTQKPGGEVEVLITCCREHVHEPLHLYWDDLAPGIADFQAVVIAL